MFKSRESDFLELGLLKSWRKVVCVLACLVAALLFARNASAIADNEMVLEMNFQRYTGGTWVLQDYDSLPTEMIYVAHSPGEATSYVDAKKYSYTLNYSNGNSYSRGVEEGGYYYGETLWFNGNEALFAGSDSITVTFREVNGGIQFSRPDWRAFSHVFIDGEELGDDGLFLPFEGGTSHQVTLVSPVSYTGTIKFDSFDQALNNKNYAYNFSFELMRQRYSGWNTDLDSFYWTFDDDDERHYQVESESSTNNYTYHISIPIGSSVTLHNIPANVMFHQGAGIPAYWIESKASYSYHDNTKTITLEGINVDGYDAKGIDDDLFYTLTRGTLDPRSPQREDYYIDTSGNFYNFGIGDGFDMVVYLMRRPPQQFMFQKVYEEGDENVEQDKMHHFQIALWDTVADKPFTNKVAYYIYDSLEETVDEDEDVRYTTPNSDGVIDIYIKAGQTVRVGRSFSQQAYAETGLELRRSTGIASSYLEETYLAGSGELPYGIRYSIAEVEDGYIASVEGDAEKIVLKNDSAGTFYNIRNENGEAFKAKLAQTGVEMPVFTNTRKQIEPETPDTGDNVKYYILVASAIISSIAIVIRRSRARV